ncbi:imine reductase family protein [Streptomyces sp. NPDC055078]
MAGKTGMAGKTLVNLANGTPAQARELAAWAAGHGARYLDGGIMASPPMIAGPDAYVFYSGDEEAFRTYQPALAALGGTKYTGTDPGSAAIYDIALLTGMYGMTMGVMQAFALARSVDIPAHELAGPLTEWVAAMLALTPDSAEAVDSGEHLTDLSSISTNQAALPNFLATFREQGVSTEFIEPLAAMLDRAMEEGHRADGLTRLVPMLMT